MNFFKKSQPEQETPPEIPSLREARKLVPSSAKSPDAQRLMLFNPDEEIDEDTDQDLAFLHSLVDGNAAVSAPAPRRTRREPPNEAPARQMRPESLPTTSEREERIDDMEVFREMSAVQQRTEVAKHLRVANVDMGDLLEDLQTTRAALRHRRKAA